MDSVMKRRSIRSYTDKPVPEEVLQTLCEAAMRAPSAHNQQPWELVVITDRSLLDTIPNFHPYSRMLTLAQAALLVCARTEGLKSEDFWVQDCAAATENVLVEATEQGLGSVWLGVYPKKPIMKGLGDLLHIPEDVFPFSLIALGYPAEEKAPSERFDPARIHRNGW